MKKYIVRANENFIFDSFERHYISALLGPRRIGKTTLIERYIQQYPDRKWTHFTMDALSQRNRIAQEELALMIEEAALQKIGVLKNMDLYQALIRINIRVLKGISCLLSHPEHNLLDG